ncbi:hypothetical protein ACHAXR_003830, partial [Thalassiosira sp. AJA248-18]
MEDLLSGMDRIANLVKAASYVHHDDVNDGDGSFSTPSRSAASSQQQSQYHHRQPPPSSSQSSSSSPYNYKSPHIQPRSTSKLLQLATACEQQQKSLSVEMSQLQQRHTQSYEQSRNGFLSLLAAEQTRVSTANERISQREQHHAAVEEQSRLDALAIEAELQNARDLAQQAELDRIAQEAARTEEERIKEQERLERLKEAELEAVEEAQLKNAHVTRAQTLIRNLEEVRSSSSGGGGGGGSSLKEFDKSKAVSRRRLQFKKIVNGKINTLAHDEAKILEVGRVVSEAITNAANDDSSAASSGGYEPVMSMGKKYLLDLLCSNLIVRVQADGFNGTRGDGFPLANMFAHVSIQCEELGPVMEGHLYTVCPTAIPIMCLDTTSSSGNDENDLMEGLGMIKDGKSGEFESFDKFLHRTEGLISIMANIMSSHPTNHTLLGGHIGALMWLQRFMDLLPPPPTSPLPLLTAPVLVAFLTGAGHMLANKYPKEFEIILDSMKKDGVLERLDESAVGVPSATRLKKVLLDGGGLEGMKRDLPKGAVASLYDDGKGGGGAAAAAAGGFASASPFGQTQHSQTSAPSSSAFGQTQHSQSSAPSSSAFGQTQHSQTSAPSSSAFGQPNSSMDNQNSFAGGANTASAAPTNSNPFSSSNWGNNSGSSANMDSNSMFGGGASSMASTAQHVDNNMSTQPSAGAAAPPPFGAFGAPVAAAPPGPSPFGMGGGTQPQQSAFGIGGGNQPQQAGFGSGFAAASPSPFGMAAPAAPAPSPFGTAPAPSGGGGFGSSPFSTAPGQQQQQQMSGFGATPFGGGAATAAPSPSPFGTNNDGMNNAGMSSGGGGGGGGNNKKPPCKFFASG